MTFVWFSLTVTAALEVMTGALSFTSPTAIVKLLSNVCPAESVTWTLTCWVCAAS